jgi:hypothetical protein
MDDREIRIRFLAASKDYSLLQRAHIGSAVHPASNYSMTPEALSPEISARGVDLATHLNLVLRLNPRDILSLTHTHTIVALCSDSEGQI